MDEWFELPVTDGETDVLLPARLLQTGYTHRFLVMVNNVEVYFEPDEEGNYRAVVDDKPDVGAIRPRMLEAVAAAIEKVLR